MSTTSPADAPTALPAPEESDYASRLAVAIGRINRRIRPTRDGISHGLVSALGSVVRLGEIRPGDLARVEAVAAPTMTRLVADLEARGLVSRRPDPSDGRSFFVVPTQAGVDLLARARFERAERMSALLDTLPEDQREIVRQATTALERASQGR
jgi:DNA-binding MarR family transcriptional regulator